MYSPSLSRFLNRDMYTTNINGNIFVPESMMGYHDGFNLYQSYFIPTGTDPSGWTRTEGEVQITCGRLKYRTEDNQGITGTGSDARISIEFINNNACKCCTGDATYTQTMINSRNGTPGAGEDRNMVYPDPTSPASGIDPGRLGQGSGRTGYSDFHPGTVSGPVNPTYSREGHFNDVFYSPYDTGTRPANSTPNTRVMYLVVQVKCGEGNIGKLTFGLEYIGQPPAATGLGMGFRVRNQNWSAWYSDHPGTDQGDPGLTQQKSPVATASGPTPSTGN